MTGRCPTPKKASYRTAVKAQAAIDAIARHARRGERRPVRAYRCVCGRWHVTAEALQ